jgi:molecular chaperone DnaK
MNRILAIDFGANNTVIASYDRESGEAKILPLREWSKPVYTDAHDIPGPSAWIIPSLIHYSPGEEFLYGEQVKVRHLTDSPTTIRWMRHYIQMGSPVRIPIDGTDIDYQTAGIDFLVPLIKRAIKEYHLKENEAAFTVPLESSEKYEEWIGIVAAHAGITRFRMIDEPSAAIYGYKLSLEKDTAVMVFDFGGSSLEVSIVVPEIGIRAVHRICRVLGRARDDVGGATIDHWLCQNVLDRIGLHPADLYDRQLRECLREACEHAKEELSTKSHVSINVHDTAKKCILRTEISRPEFETLLNSHELITRIHQIIQRALNTASMKGFSEDRIGSVLMVGGCSSIPAVQHALKERFGSDRVFCSHPCDAVAGGAALFMSGQELIDYIHHDYGIRFWNSRTGDYDYRIVVRRGTCIPSNNKTAQFFVKGTYDGQTHMGISVFEIGTGIQNDQSRELMPDPWGGYRLVESALENQDQEKKVNQWINEHNPTLLIANPPAKKGEIRFEVWFDIDGNKRLLLSSRDVKTGRMVDERVPIAQMS